MSSMSDRYLYLGLGLTLLLSTRLISSALSRTATLNLIRSSSAAAAAGLTASPPDPDPDASPSLPLPALSTLASSPNPDIARSATLLLLERLSSSPNQVASFIDDLFSPFPQTRKRASYLHGLYDRHAYRGGPPNPAAVWQGLLDEWMPWDADTPAAPTVRRVYALARRMERDDGPGPMRRLRSLARDMRGDRTLIACEQIREAQVVVWIEVVRGLLGDLSGQRLVTGTRLLKEAREMGDLEAEEVWELLKGEWEEEDGVEEEDRVLQDVSGRLEVWDSEVDHAEIGWSGIDGDRQNLPLARAGRRPRFHEEAPEVIETRRWRREAMVLHVGDGEVHREDIFQRYNNDE